MPAGLTDPHITEPMTMMTDYVLGAQSGFYAVVLGRKAQARRRGSIPLWMAAFLVTAVAAFAGGTAHGFALYLGAYRPPVWSVTVFSIALSAVLMIAAGVRSVVRPLSSDPERRQSGKRWLVRGIMATVAGLLVQQSGWSLHTHLNHNDIYHLIQMLGICFLYRGALVLHDLE